MRQIPPKDLTRIVKMEKKREIIAYEGINQDLTLKYDKIWAIHKNILPLPEMKELKQECSAIIAGLEKEIKVNASPFQFAIELNESLAIDRKSYLEKFKWLMATIDKEISAVTLKNNAAQ